MPPAPDGEPLYAPASYQSDALPATSVPSRLAPSFMRIVVADVGPDARNTSSRVITILTGSPDLRESAMASGSRYTGIFPPKPPPISLGTTLMAAASMPRIAAHASRTTNGPCVVHHTRTWPSWPY